VFQISSANPEVDYNFFEETTGLPCMPRDGALVEAADTMFMEAPVLNPASAGGSPFEVHVPTPGPIGARAEPAARRAEPPLPSLPATETECKDQEERVGAVRWSTGQAARSPLNSTLGRQVES
jgi:hypothetical protein